MCVSCTQWLLKTSHRFQYPYVDTECQQGMSGLLGASRYLYGYQNTARRTGTRLKRRHYTTPGSNFVVQCTSVAFSLYAGMLKEAEVMAIVWTVHAAANVVTL
ncbi:hypothetical protein TNCV_641051 [Trichonephila clavipes]|nr:hypothetical protein TNCV_641051 [Trichonephila clavipes]